MPDEDEIFPTSESKQAFEDFRRGGHERRLLASNTGDIIERGKHVRSRAEELLNKALEVIERSQEVNNNLAKSNSDLAQTVTSLARQLGLPLPDVAPAAEPEPAAKQEKPWRPTILEWRKGYAAFRAHMMGVENKMPKHLRKNKNNYADRLPRGGSRRRITEAMRHYHLPDDLMPPSAWPEEEPGTIGSLRGTKIGDLRHYAQVAAVFSITAGLDLFADSRLDGAVRFIKHCLDLR